MDDSLAGVIGRSFAACEAMRRKVLQVHAPSIGEQRLDPKMRYDGAKAGDCFIRPSFSIEHIRLKTRIVLLCRLFNCRSVL